MTSTVKLCLLILVTVLSWCSPVLADINLASPPEGAIGEHLRYFQEAETPLGFEQAAKRFATPVQKSQSDILSLGIGAPAVWLHFSVWNPSSREMTRVLLLETAWLDSIQVWYRLPSGDLEQELSGDLYPFDMRVSSQRYYSFQQDFPSGRTEVYLRVATADPMVVPLYLQSPDQSRQRELAEGYFYGAVYGFLFALLIYNAVLSFSLRSGRYLFYALYLACFLMMNVAYSGHGFMWLWGSSLAWQQWGNPVLMVAYGLSGLIFASRFLEVTKRMPKVGRLINLSCLLLPLLLLFCWLSGQIVLALLLAFAFVVVFTVAMIMLGAISLWRGVVAARYFLLASVCAMAGAVATALTVWGWVGYTRLGYHAVEIGMLFEAVLLALALSHQFRVIQAKRTEAEQLAEVDQLTGLYNRHGFEKVSSHLFSTAARHRRDIAVILLDIDYFKAINDSYGHVTGDEVLRQVAGVIEESSREGDVCMRWGGEEFLILMPETTHTEAVALADRLRNMVSHTAVVLEDTTLHFTASFGVAHQSDDNGRIEQLINRADSALYQAKAQGRNQVCCQTAAVLP